MLYGAKNFKNAILLGQCRSHSQKQKQETEDYIVSYNDFINCRKK
jgi:hypothetical protein